MMVIRGENERAAAQHQHHHQHQQQQLTDDGRLKTTTTAATTTSLKNNNSGTDVAAAAAAVAVTQENNNATFACWDNLPSVILLEVFSYLPRESRIQASQVCRNWRCALFHPSFWKKITFTLVDDDSVVWSRCMSSWFKFSVQDVTILCESAHNFVKEAMCILRKLSGNTQLRKLFLEPTRCMFEYYTEEVNSDKLLKQLLAVIKTSNCLEALSLGCIEELSEDLSDILESLKQNHANHLTHLSLASVKEDPDRYDFSELECSVFHHFHRLSILSIDYDHVCDDLLNALNSGIMERLVIHVHGWNGDYIGASIETWEAFTMKNPRCELRLNLIHSYNAVRVLDTEILKPAMPLTHLKVLFCESVNYAALNQISHWYSNTLQSLIWIDSFNFEKNLDYLNNIYDYGNINNPDCLVLAAWRCKNLNEIVFIGQTYFLDNLLAIVRLRHNMLKRLEFAESNIVFEGARMGQNVGQMRKAIIEEVKEVMGKQWKLLSDEELPKVVIDPVNCDSREVIMPMVLRDQK